LCSLSTTDATSDAAVLLVPGANPAASFIDADRRILRELVDLAELAPGAGLASRLAFARRLGAVLAGGRVRLVVLWFAAPGYGAIVATRCRLSDVPYLVVAGGADVARHPEAGFGDARRPWRRAVVAQVLAGARVVWAFSAAARTEIESVTRPARLRVVAPAVDTAFYAPAGVARETQVLTTCSVINRLTIRQKGLDRVMALARARPAVSFVVTGRVETADAAARAFVASAPPNVSVAGFVSRETLRDLYARSRVYVQLSVHEGFGVAVAEAIAMGCTPLVSDLASLRALVQTPEQRVARPDSLEEGLTKLDRALDGSYAATGWAEIDRRFGLGARRDAWIRELREMGLIANASCVDLPRS
jgi:hypothetical protein